MLRCLLLASRDLANRAAVRGVSLATTEGVRKISQGAVLSSPPSWRITVSCCSHPAIFRATAGGTSLARQEQARPTLTRAALTYSFSFLMRRQGLMTPSKDMLNVPLRLSQMHNGGVRCARSFWSAGRGVGGGGGGGGQPLSALFNTFKRVGGALAVPFVVAWKYKMAALSALKLTKLSSLASLAMTTAGYAWLFGVPYGVGVTFQILIHESGHALALMRYGVPFQPMVFVPFMGAYVAHAGILNAWRNAMVALAGPGAGFAAAFALYVAAVMASSSTSSSSSSPTTNRSSWGGSLRR